MGIIERYIFKRVTVMFIAGLFGVVGIVWTAQVIQKINLVTDNGQSIGGFLYLSLFAIPSVVPVVTPFALALAAAHALNVMNTDSELVVINASGAPRTTVLRPLLLLAFAVSAMAFLVANFIEPYADQKRRRLVLDARSDLISTIIQEGAFRKIDDNLYIQIAERTGGGGLGGIFVSDSRDKAADLIYYAKTGLVARRDEGDVLVLSDGEIQRKTVKGEVSTIKFNTYAFDLAEFTGAANEVTISPRSQTLGYLLQPDPNDRFLKDQPNMFAAEIHARFTDWVYSLVFALVAFAVAGDARSHRGARFNPIVTVIVIALIMRWLGFIAYNKTTAHAPYFVSMYAIPIAFAAVAVLFIGSNKSLEPPASILEKLTEAWEKGALTRARWAQALRGFGALRGGGRP